MLGKGKYGPVELILSSENTLQALKRITKASITSQKRSQHVLQEKNVQAKCQDLPFVQKMLATFTTTEDVCFVFEYLPG